VKTILFIGGGRETTYAVKQARDMGLRTIIADECRDCACFDIADEFVHAKIQNAPVTAQLVSLREGLSYSSIDGVICAGKPSGI